MYSKSEKYKQFFDTDHIKKDLKGKSVRGGAFTMAGQGIKFFLQMGSTVVLARLLTPDDYGLIAMVAVVTNFVMMFKEAGLSMATVQKAEIDHDQISTLFWINTALCLVIMIFMAGLSPVIAWFYGKPELTLVTLALSGTFIFSGMTIQHQALLRRQMHFGRLAIIEIVAMFLSIAAAIISALYGLRYWSLVIMQLVTAVSIAVGVWIACGWRPGLPKRGSGVRSMLAFGGNLTGFNFVNYFARNADKIIIGKFIGSVPLGYYNKAYNLLMLPIQQINGPIASVAIPALSRLQGEPQRYRNYYHRAINLIAFITMPMVFVMAALSEEIIELVLGSQWSDAAIIFKILAFSAVIQPILNTMGWIFVSFGQSDRMMRWGLMSSPVIVLSFLVGLPWGITGVAVSYTVCMSLIIPLPCMIYAFRHSPITVLGAVKSVIRPFLIGLAIYLTIEICGYYLDSLSSVLLITYGCLIGVGVFGLAMLLWSKARYEFKNIINLALSVK